MSEFEKAPLFGEDTTLVEQHQRSSSFKKLLSKERFLEDHWGPRSNFSPSSLSSRGPKEKLNP